MKILLSVFVILGLCACASHSPYNKADSERDYGYSESRITENRYRVTFKGNTRTSSNEVKDMALLRAAEITMLNNYDWFRIVDQETEGEKLVDSSVSTGISTPTQVQKNCGLLGCTTTVSPGIEGAVITTQNIDNRYNTSIEIVMGNGKVDDVTEVYDAAELRRNLAARF